MREEKNENSKRTKSMISYGGKWNEKQGLVFWFSGASLARVAAGLIGTSDVFFCLCYAKANLYSKLILHPLYIYIYVYVCVCVVCVLCVLCVVCVLCVFCVCFVCVLCVFCVCVCVLCVVMCSYV